jgi:putative colanic acid biosynthesis UDP-glucose lipid carrier transferase
LLSVVFLWFWCSLSIWESLDYALINLPWNYALVAIAGLAVATFGSLQRYGLFFMKNGWGRIRESLLKANFQTALIAFFVFASYFATKDNETSRLFLVFYITTSWPLLASFNFALPGLFKRFIGFQLVTRKSLLIGDSNSLDSLHSWIQKHTEKGFSFEGTFTTDSNKPSLGGLSWLGSYDRLESYLRENKTHQLILLPNSDMKKWIRLVADLGAKYGCRILVYNNLSGYFDSRLVFVEESGRQFFSLQNEPLESPFNQMIKRCFDLAISLPALFFIPSVSVIKTSFSAFRAEAI